MSGKHTPGPWVAQFVRYGGTRILADNKPIVWVPPDETVEDPSTGRILETTSDEADACARLIAAAPDLLEALQGLIEFVPHAGGLPDLRKAALAARVAIAKATGETP
jgi:hypothetical protein